MHYDHTGNGRPIRCRHLPHADNDLFDPVRFQSVVEVGVGKTALRQCYFNLIVHFFNRSINLLSCLFGWPLLTTGQSENES
jgi:hypothetical protein